MGVPTVRSARVPIDDVRHNASEFRMTTFPKIELSAFGGAAGDKAAAQAPGAGPAKVADEADWSKLRKAAPLNILLPSTRRWAEELPPDVRPKELMVRYPRLANMAAASWGSAVAFRDYLDILLIDRRGSRQGFSPEIRAEFEQLRTFYFFGWYKSANGVSIYRDEPPLGMRNQ
jgi:hypothetical protein